MTTFDTLIQRRKFEPTQFADLVESPAWQPCNAKDDPFLTVGTTLLMAAPVLIVLFFAVL